LSREAVKQIKKDRCAPNAKKHEKKHTKKKEKSKKEK